MAGREFGHEVTAETRAKIAAALRGRKGATAGRPLSEEHKAKLRGPRGPNPSLRDANAANWKGEDAGYMAKHNWIRRLRGKASKYLCERCGWHAQEWANISGEYRRDPGDYMPLCIPCHRTMDGHRTRMRRAGAAA